MLKALKEKAGFTLIEIMIVVIILAILAAAVIPRLTGRTEQAKVARAKADINGTLPLALDMYSIDNGAYPTTAQGLAALRTSPTSPPIPSNWKGPYIKKNLPTDPWGKSYIYVCPGTHNREDYDLSSYGPDGAEGGADDVANWEADTP